MGRGATHMTIHFDLLADRILAGGLANETEALEVLRTSDAEVLGAVSAAARLRRAHFANTVKVNYLVNLKSGLFPENCNRSEEHTSELQSLMRISYAVSSLHKTR